MTRLLLRWSWRDLRARWIQVAAIALVIAIGTGAYAGLASGTEWRRSSADQSYEQLNMYDLRLRFTTGNAVQAGALVSALEGLNEPRRIARAQERLVVPTQVDASTANETVLVPGEIIGMEIGASERVNDVRVVRGEGLDAEDEGEPNVLLERNFAQHYGLDETGTVVLAGGHELRYTGHALVPEHFLVTPPSGGFLAEANYAVVVTSIQTARDLVGAGEVVNDLVIQLTPGVEAEALEAEIAALVRDAIPDAGFDINSREEDSSYRTMYADIEGDQRVYEILALLVFLGASGAAFNLTQRVVESQRREIGMAMALGVSRPRVAIRPLLVGAQIAFAGVVLGLVVGFVISQAVARIIESFVPMPVFDTSFQFGLFAQVAVVGFLVPFAAAAYPVWRAVRVRPVEAIRPAHFGSSKSGLAPLIERVPLPGNTFWQLPLRNLLRTPWRVLLAVVGMGAAVAVAVMFVGLIDSFLATLDRNEQHLLGDNPSRVTVELDRVYDLSSEGVTAIGAAESVRAAEPRVRLPGTLLTGTGQLSLIVETADFDEGMWSPSLIEGEVAASEPGIILAEQAAADAGLGVGDIASVVLPRLTPSGQLANEAMELPVQAIHGGPLRYAAYIDSQQAELLALEGMSNIVDAYPAQGAEAGDVQRELFTSPGVVSVQPVTAFSDAIDEALSQFVVLLRLFQGIGLFLAALIAFNLAAINMDERSREHATMFAYGVPIRTVIRMAVTETFVMGLLATLLGLLGGALVVQWILGTIFADTVPDLAIGLVLEPYSLAIILAIGVVAVATVPLLMWRRLQRMNIASTLRLQE